MKGTAAIPTSVTGMAAEPENQPMPVWIQKKSGLAKEVKAGPLQEQEEETEHDQEVTTQSLSLSELWEIQKDFSFHPGEHIITWML